MLKRNRTEGSHHDNIDEAQLLAYVEGSLSPEEQFRIETLLEQDPFLNDAVEGLAEIKDKAQLKAIAGQINAQLRKQIQSRRKQRRRRPKLEHHWGWLFALILLLLVLLSWWVIKQMPAH
ncbi:hypothetical protein [Taibaiella koreensis]|uniref:hypothetical protein n=1 Tax=Taibaiella koreensis TaxID=1268548 RepID=UPI000E59A6EE|nr:hypothetical protein [Taibaiella koreensis]